MGGGAKDSGWGREREDASWNHAASGGVRLRVGGWVGGSSLGGWVVLGGVGERVKLREVFVNLVVAGVGVVYRRGALSVFS